MPTNRGPEQTKLVNAKIHIDEELKDYLGHDLLAKPLPPHRGDTESSCREALTHVFVGTLSECSAEAERILDESAGTLKGADCGRSGRDVELIHCTESGVTHLGTFKAVASHRSSERDAEGYLIVKDLLLTQKKDETLWTELFRDSFHSKCQ